MKTPAKYHAIKRGALFPCEAWEAGKFTLGPSAEYVFTRTRVETVVQVREPLFHKLRLTWNAKDDVGISAEGEAIADALLVQNTVPEHTDELLELCSEVRNRFVWK